LLFTLLFWICVLKSNIYNHWIWNSYKILLFIF
jgi:hypothetical protein